MRTGEKGRGGTRLTWRDAHGKHCQRGLNEVQVVNYLEAKAPVVKILPTMIYAFTT